MLLWVLLGYVGLHFWSKRARGDSKVGSALSFLNDSLRLIDNLTYFKGISTLLVAWIETMLSRALDFAIEALSDPRNESLILAEKVEHTVASLEAEYEALSQKHAAFIDETNRQRETALQEFTESLKETQTRALCDYRVSIGATDSRLKEGQVLDLIALQKLWASTENEDWGDDVQGVDVLDILIDAMLDPSRETLPVQQTTDSSGTARGDPKASITINPLLFALVSPVFEQFLSRQNLEISGISMERFSAFKRLLRCSGTEADAVLAINVADYFNAQGIVRELRRCWKEGGLPGFLALVNLSGERLNLGDRNHSDGQMEEIDEDCSPVSIPLSDFSPAAFDCLPPLKFPAFLSGRTFSSAEDLEILESYVKHWSSQFDLGLLDVENLHASVLPICERILDPEAYATLLTRVLANIERENERLSKLRDEQLAGEDVRPLRQFRYSIN